MSLHTKEKIINALLTLMKDHSFYDITISELCAWSQVSRGTFYNNFSAKEDVIAQASRDIIQHYLSDLPTDFSFLKNDLVLKFFTVNRENHHFFLLLKKDNLSYIYKRELYTLVGSEEFMFNQMLRATVPESILRYLIPSYTASLLLFYEIWSDHGFQETAEELAHIYHEIYKKDSSLL